MGWTVNFSKKAARQTTAIDKKIKIIVRLLVDDLQRHGPIPGRHWINYSKLKGAGRRDLRHCHLKKGNPTHVCCWEVVCKQTKVIEVYYVGTHEKAPY